jgi:hypothetical protein
VFFADFLTVLCFPTSFLIPDKEMSFSPTSFLIPTPFNFYFSNKVEESQNADATHPFRGSLLLHFASQTPLTIWERLPQRFVLIFSRSSLFPTLLLIPDNLNQLTESSTQIFSRFSSPRRLRFPDKVENSSV